MLNNFKLDEDKILVHKRFSKVTPENKLQSTSYQYAISPVDAALLQNHIGHTYPPLDEKGIKDAVIQYGGQLHSTNGRHAVEHFIDDKKVYTQDCYYHHCVGEHFYKEVDGEVKLSMRSRYARNGLHTSLHFDTETGHPTYNCVTIPVKNNAELVVDVCFEDDLTIRTQRVDITHEDGTVFSQNVDTAEYLHQCFLRNGSICWATSAQYGQLTALELTMWKLIRDVDLMKSMIDTNMEIARDYLGHAIGDTDTVEKLIRQHKHIKEKNTPSS